MYSITFLLICLVSYEIVKCDSQSKVDIEDTDLPQRLAKARLQSSQRSHRDDSQQQTDATVNHLMCITCEARLEELQKNLTNILNAYSNLCNEVRRITGHLSLHEQAIENIAVNSLKTSGQQRNHQSFSNECIGNGCSDRHQHFNQRMSQTTHDLNSQIHRTGDHVHVSESQSQSQSYHSSRQYLHETKVLREQRVVNNGTHTIYYSTTQTGENGEMSKPETTVRVFLNSPDQQIYQNQEKVKFDDLTQKRQRRNSENIEPLEWVTKPTKTVVGEDIDNIELVSKRPNDISPEELRGLHTDMPWEVDAQKPIPFQRKPKQRVFDSTAGEEGCRAHQSNCFTNQLNQCNQYSVSQRKSRTFQEKYKKWVQSLIGNQTTKPNSILYSDNWRNIEPQTMESNIDYQRFDGDANYPRTSQQRQQNHQSFVEGKKLDETKVDEFDRSITDSIYATCSMTANRHIPLILQEDIEGTINMWQNRLGGPVFMEIKLRGLKTPLNVVRSRFRRESNIVEVRVPPPTPSSSVDSEPKCLRGFHVHEFGNITKGCQYTGTHYNPKRLLHGGPLHIIRHVGDLGNIVCDQNGTVDMELVFQKVSLIGEHSIIGRSIVIHSEKDDFGRNPSDAGSASNGNSGPKIACCVIEKVDRLPQFDRRPATNS